MILTELEWIVEMSDDDDSDSSLSSCGSLSWDNFNERKCEMSDTEELSENLTDDDYEVSSIASISSSPNEEKEESLEDVFQTVTPTSPTKTQPTSLSNPSPIKYVTISCSSVPSCSTPRQLTAVVRVGLTAPEVGLIRTPCTSFTDTEDESEIEEVNERKCEPKVEVFVSKMSAKIAALLQARRLSIHKLILITSTPILSRTFPNPNPIPSMVAPKNPNFMTRAIFKKDAPSSTSTLLVLMTVMTQMLESSRFLTCPSLATYGQVGNSRFMQPILQELLVLHQVLQVSSLEEEEQEDEKKKKRGDATLDDSHLTVHMICNSCGCIYC